MQKRSCLLLILILFLLAAPPAMFAASVQLSWQPNAEPDLQEYNVYYGTQPRSYGPPIPVDKSATYTLSGLDEGMVYYFAVSAVDNNGNESGFSEEISKTIASSDAQPPTVTITSPTSAQTLTTENNQITVAGTASDDHDLQQVSWSSSSGHSGTASGTENWSIDAIGLVEGANLITVTATDTSSNQATDTLTITYIAPDTIAPIVSITTPAAASGETFQTTSGSLQLAGTAQDDRSISQVTWSIGNTNGVAQGTTNWSIPLVSLSQGLNTIAVTAEDDAGNRGSASLSVMYTIPDMVAPMVTITSPTSADIFATVSNLITLSGNASDDRGLEKITWTSSSGSSGTATGTDSWTVASIKLAEGPNVITITAVDTKGNQATDSITVTYAAPDTQAPVVIISAPSVPSGETLQTTQGSIQLSGTAQDDRAVSQVTWSTGNTGGVAQGATSWSIPSVSLSVGLNNITVTAEDAAGNKGSATLSVMYTIPDTVAPVVTITAPTSADAFTSENSQISLSGTASDDRGLQQITWTSSTGNSGTASGTDNWSISGINLASGVQILTITATDGAGNRSSDKLTVTYDAADTTTPTVAITSPTTKTYYFSRTDTVAISGKASDEGGIAKVTWRNSRGESGTCNGTDNWQASGIKLNRWWNTVTVTAIDKAGNTDEYSLKVFRWK